MSADMTKRLKFNRLLEEAKQNCEILDDHINDIERDVDDDQTIDGVPLCMPLDEAIQDLENINYHINEIIDK